MTPRAQTPEEFADTVIEAVRRNDCIGKHSPWETCPNCDRYDDNLALPLPRAKTDHTLDWMFFGLMALLIVAVFGTVIVWMLVA